MVTISDGGVHDVWAAALLKHVGFARACPLVVGVAAWPDVESGEPPREASVPPGVSWTSEVGDQIVLDVRSAGEFAQGHIAGLTLARSWLHRAADPGGAA